MTAPDRDMNRRVAELLGYAYVKVSEDARDGFWQTSSSMFGNCFTDYSPSTNENQASAAVREWCGDDMRRQRDWASRLMGFAMNPDGKRDGVFVIGTATPEQKIRALLAAADALKDGGA